MTDDKMRFRELLKVAYKRAGSVASFDLHEKHEGPWLAICYDAMSRAYELDRGVDEEAVERANAAYFGTTDWRKKSGSSGTPEAIETVLSARMRAALLAAFPNAKEPGE